MQPAPEHLLEELVATGQLTAEAAMVARVVPMSEDICATADSGGHTDQGVTSALLPVTLGLRDEAMAQHRYQKRIRVGAAGGIGTPQAAAAAFVMGADFIVTCSINHCTVEAATSVSVKDMLQVINVQDTAYAPAGDMFELGAKVQVLRRGLFFPARANRLYAVYQQYDSLDAIDAKTRRQIEDRYFKRSFDDVWQETRARLTGTSHQDVELAERNPKHKMGLVFRWYFDQGSRLARSGDVEQRVNYQVHCGPALGAFNQWVRDTELADWRRRHVADIAERLLAAAADLLNERFAAMTAG
jgi:trans-AT polyketide synthase/acyltransferase/oxidoreductase domain-containing protein